ncbi:hypothetical protein GCM10010353_20400 [Streptomyces chryseus]|nr:hypothetical protein GCM10010353_20400 [Streptomyces chryseus]
MLGDAVRQLADGPGDAPYDTGRRLHDLTHRALRREVCVSRDCWGRRDRRYSRGCRGRRGERRHRVHGGDGGAVGRRCLDGVRLATPQEPHRQQPSQKEHHPQRTPPPRPAQYAQGDEGVSGQGGQGRTEPSHEGTERGASERPTMMTGRTVWANDGA